MVTVSYIYIFNTTLAITVEVGDHVEVCGDLLVATKKEEEKSE